MADFYDFPKLPGEYAGKHPIAASTLIKSGGLTALDASGNLVMAASGVTGFVNGRAAEEVDNSAGLAAAKSALVERGVFDVQLDATNPPTKAHVGKTVFAITPDTVAHTGTCRAGILLGFTAAGNAILDTTKARLGPTVADTTTDGVAAAASANLSGLAAETEKIGDLARAILAALKTQGILN